MPVTIEDAREVSRVIVREIDPIAVIVFGSVATRNMGNDLDLLIVTEGHSFEPANRRVHREIRRFQKRFATDPFVIPLDRLIDHFKRGSQFLRLVQKQGRALYVKDSIRQWLKQVEEECAMAEYLLQGGYHRGACFHAQQAIEKSFEAALIQKGWEREKIHHIGRLNVLAEEYGVRISLKEEDILFIDSIYRSRYPAEEGLLPLGDPSEKEAKRAISLAQKAKKDLLAGLEEP
jgi:HEPN domain-containing protein